MTRLSFPLRLLWGLPNTTIGLALATVARAGGARAVWRAGVLELEGGALRRLLALLPIGPRSGTAITLGRVVLATCRATLEATRDHERVHVEQSERWGPFFLPAYAAASLVAHFRGRDAYLGNRFEREAIMRSSGAENSTGQALSRGGWA